MIQIKQSKIAVIFMILAVVSIVIAVGTVYVNNNDVVATVDGEKISKEELYEFLVGQNGQQALDMLVTEKVIDLEAKKQNVVITEADLEKELEKVKEYYGGPEAFNQTIEGMGYSVDDVKIDLAMNMKIKKLLEPYIPITDEEMEIYFNENQGMFNTEEQVKGSHILVDTEEQANEVKEKLANGDDFSELAKEYSTDLTNNEYGGDLGFIKRGEMVKEFEDAVFSLDIGVISEPVKTEYGYHIIRVDEKIEAKEAKYGENKEEIKEILFDEKMQTEYFTWLDEIYSEYEIKNLL